MNRQTVRRIRRNRRHAYLDSARSVGQHEQPACASPLNHPIEASALEAGVAKSLAMFEVPFEVIALYRPGNDSEGRAFMRNFCYQCQNDSPEAEDYCNILNRTMAFDLHDPLYPSEWCYIGDKPTCTAFVSRHNP